MSVREVAQATMRRTYVEGLEHGSIEVLQRLLGGHAEGPAVVAPETEQWARDCLARIARTQS